MKTVNKSKTAKLLDPANARLDGQAQVNAEMFTAMEILGRKLERSEAERDRVVQRLAQIESAATVDEKTGKLYLPVVANSALAKQNAKSFAPKWMGTAALMSSMVTFFILGIMFFRDPAPFLTKEQMAALDSLKGIHQFATLSSESKGWKPLEEKQQDIEIASEDFASFASTVFAPSAESVPFDESVTMAEAQPSYDFEVPDLKEILSWDKEVPPISPAVVALSDEAAVIEPAAGGSVDEIEVVTVEEVIESEIHPVVLAEREEYPSFIVEVEDDVAEQVILPVLQQEKLSMSLPLPPPVVIAEVDADMEPDSALPEKLAQLEKRAYQGISEAEHDLATLYASGRLVTQNYDRAVYWFARAADGGVANAHYNLGVIYHQGLGVTADVQKALSRYENAAELGHPEAMYNLGIAYVEGIGTEMNIEKGVSYFKRAANVGVAQAAYNLGVLYESNFIGSIDLDKAAEWYQVASEGGHTDARVAFNRLGGVGNPLLTLADMAEPASGVAEYGEGDSSPVEEDRPAPKRVVKVKKAKVKSVVKVEKAESVPEPDVNKDDLLYKVQLELQREGLLPGQVDGVMDKWMERSIRVYQKKLGLPEDGIPSEALLGKMYHTVNR